MADIFDVLFSECLQVDELNTKESDSNKSEGGEKSNKKDNKRKREECRITTKKQYYINIYLGRE